MKRATVREKRKTLKLRRSNATSAVSRMRSVARVRGTDRLTMKEIDAIVADTRLKRVSR